MNYNAYSKLSAAAPREGWCGECRASASADCNCRCKNDDRLERKPVRHFAVVTSLLVACFVSSSANAQRVVAETFMIPAVDPGIQLHVRNKRLEGRESFPAERVVLFVHGATYPFRNRLRYRSARRGVGGSRRPQGLRRLSRGCPRLWPLHAARGDGRAGGGESAVRDDGRRGEGCQRRGRLHSQAPRHLQTQPAGWSWGTAIMAGYAMSNSERVNKLVLYAPLWHLKAPPPFSGSGAYRVVSS